MKVENRLRDSLCNEIKGYFIVWTMKKFHGPLNFVIGQKMRGLFNFALYSYYKKGRDHKNEVSENNYFNLVDNVL